MIKIDRKNQRFLSYFVAYLMVVLAIPFIIEAKNFPSIFDLHFNAYAILTAIGIASLVVTGIYLVRYQTVQQDSLWLIVGLVTTIIFGFGELFQRLSVEPSGALFWSQIGNLAVPFSATGFFLFALNYTKPKANNTFFAAMLLMGAGLIAFFGVNGGIIYETQRAAIKLYPWGYNNDIGQGFIAYALWIFSLYLGGVVLFFNLWRHTGNKLLKRQSMLFGVAIAIPVVGGVIFDALLPAFNINIIPPLAMLLMSVNGVMLVIGAIKYRVFQFTPAVLSSNILSTMNETVIVTNKELEIEFTNVEASALLNKKPKEIIHQNIVGFFDGQININDFVSRLHKPVGKTGILPIEDLSITVEGTKKSIQILVAEVEDNKKVEGYVFVLSDVTKLKRAYADLETAKAGVEHTVEVRTRELREAQEKLLEVDKMKTEFITIASHNLRTPLVTISGYADMLSDIGHDKSEQDMIASLQASSKRLTKLINDLLTISTIEAGEMKLEPKRLNVSELLADLTSGLQESNNVNNDRFRASIEVGDSVIMANPERLKAALDNILDNSFKFTKDGEVDLSAKIEENNLVIIIQDNGTGIKEDELYTLFTPFHRGTDIIQYDYEGEGIGLHLAKIIIEQHGGKITVNSQLNVGTKVTVSLPLVK